jgi:hypothetical protein
MLRRGKTKNHKQFYSCSPNWVKGIVLVREIRNTENGSSGVPGRRERRYHCRPLALYYNSYMLRSPSLLAGPTDCPNWFS